MQSYQHFTSQGTLHTYKNSPTFYIKVLILIAFVMSFAVFWYYNGNTIKPTTFLWIGGILSVMMFLNVLVRKVTLDTTKRIIRSKVAFFAPAKVYSFDNFVAFEIVSMYHSFIYGGKTLQMIFEDDVGNEKRIPIDSNMYNTQKIQQIIEEISALMWIKEPAVDETDSRMV